MAIRVFISYSHDSQGHMDRVWELSERLRRNGIDCRVDQAESWPADGWPQWCKDQLQEADFCLVVCSETYQRRFQRKEHPGIGLGTTFEGFVINQEFYYSGAKNKKYIPIVFASSDLQQIPIELRSYPHFNVSVESNYRDLFRILTGWRKEASPIGPLLDPTAETPSQPPPTRATGSLMQLRRRQDFSHELRPTPPFPKTAAVIYFKISGPEGDDRPSELIHDSCASASKREVIGNDIVALVDASPNFCPESLRMAEACILGAEREIIRASGPRFHIRIGVATGEVDSRRPFGGLVYSEAKTLCESATDDEIFVSGKVKDDSLLPPHRFKRSKWSNCFVFRVRRLIRSAPTDFSGRGLVRLYPNRRELAHDFPPSRLIGLAAPKSTVLAAGRTLISWTRLVSEIKNAAEELQVRFQFLLSSPESCQVLSPQEQTEIKKDTPRSRLAFRELKSSLSSNQTPIEIRETDQAVVDGIVCTTVVLPGEEDASRQTLLVIYDVNATLGEGKPALLFACSQVYDDTCQCMAHGLYRRTVHRFQQAKELSEEPPGPGDILVLRDEGLTSRNNRPANYLSKLRPHFQTVRRLQDKEDTELEVFPPPLCVQLQVSGICSTYCEMCDHHLEKVQGLSVEKWEKVFKELADFGVGACIFSGGEPLMRNDITRLLRSAKSNKLSIGLLTNGTSASDSEQFRGELLQAIYDCVSWVAVSVDGLPEDDERIRHPLKGEQIRIERLQEFCRYFRSRIHDDDAYRQFLSATVTLQECNIGSDLRLLTEFIHETLGIAQVNFKLATGGRQSLAKAPDFLPTVEEFTDLRRFLWSSQLSEQPGNNLAYLRRCFAQGIFEEKSATDGVPLREFYTKNQLRCFMPFIFALIDVDGQVYPCCHLYRDNHGSDPESRKLRAHHALGNVLESTFQQVWNAEPYRKKRNELTVIRPDGNYAPCGECTRYCQHNIGINRLFRHYERDPNNFVFGTADNKPVWI
ncbi:MAG: SPASM domain-containing protein [Acidobacteriia bacterium]|nr:SPASM domain-containing protein [Terriglobia bacterium]